MNDMSPISLATVPPSIAELVAHLRANGVALRVEDGRLRYVAPKGTLEADALATLRSRRDELVAFLTASPTDEASLEASPGQARLWFLERAGLAGHGYVTPLNLRLDGVLDTGRLRLALQQIVWRHAALRTAFVERDGKPWQVVHPAAPFQLPVTDLSDAAEPQTALAILVDAENRRPFNLTAPPLLRARLVQLGAQSHALLMAFHHIAFDGWSLRVFLDELGALYEGAALPPLRGSLPALAAAQATRHDPAGVAFWRETLNELQRTELPTDRAPSASPSGEGDALRFRLPPEALALARAEGATNFIVLLASFLLTLGRETGQDRPAVGIPVANRSEPDSEGLIGFLVNTLVMRGDLTGDPSFRTLLRRTRSAWVAAMAHQELPFDRVVEAVQPQRSLSRTPLFSILFAVQDAVTAAPRMQMEGVAISNLDLAGLAARFDLEVHCWPDADGLAGIALRDIAVLDAGDSARLVEHWRRTLAAVADAPDLPLSALPNLSPQEAGRLAAWNDTATGEPPRLLHAAFTAMAQAMPGQVALEWAGETVTYAELEAQSDQIAAALQAEAAGPETPVVVCMDRGAPLYAAVLGVLKAGACLVSLDPDNPPSRRCAMAAAAGATLGIVAPHLVSSFPDLRPITPLDAPVAKPALHPDNLAAIIFTSGSTGVPKGVEVTHRALANVVQWHVTRLGDRGHRTLGFTHQSFDVFHQEAFTTWALGGTLVVLGAAARRDPERVAETIEADGIERLFMPFSPLAQTLDVLERRGGGHGLRELHTAGEAVMSTPALQAFLAARPALRLINHYGPTEAYVVTSHGVRAQDDPVPIGRPVDNLSIRLLDGLQRSVPPGAPGEIVAGGWGVARGYRGRPDLTAERFRPDPFGPPGARCYLTGDRGRLAADGTLRYLGRLDSQLKLRGFRVEPAEVHRVLLDGPELVAATVGLLDGRLVAHVVLAGRDEPMLLAALDARVAERLPDYMRPATIVKLPVLPLLPNGKIDRAALPAPEISTPIADRPRSAIEEALGALFAEVLGRSGIGVYEDFFLAGGHSLLATQLVSRIRSALGVELPLRALFEAPTIAGVAALLDATTSPPEPPRAGHAPADLAPLSFAQARLWLLDRLGLVSHAYTMPVTLRLRGPLDAAALGLALRELVLRHEPLRTQFREIDGEPVQALLPPPSAALEIISATESDLPGLQVAEHARPFDLAAGAPYRMRLLHLEPDDHVLLGAIHHIAADGWSLQIIVRELAALYRHHVAGGPSLPQLKLRYADFACWQRAVIQGERQARDLAYWRTRLTGVPKLALPSDRRRPAHETFRGASVQVVLPPGLATTIAAFGRARGATAFMTLLAGFMALLHRLSGQARFAVGVPVANRNRGETEGLIGFFVNSIALDAECGDDPSFETHLARVREACLGAFAHQDLPFERVVQDLAPGRDLSGNPVFNTIFAVQAGETMAPRIDLHGLDVVVMPPPAMTVRFDMELHLWPQDGTFTGFLAYNTDLFDAATITAWVGAYLALLEAGTASPQHRLSHLPLMPGDAVDGALLGPPAAGSDLVSRFATIAAAQPFTPALIGEGFALTYAQLDARSDQLAASLRGAGFAAESIVALDMPRGPDAIVMMLAVLKAGGAYLPLDPALPQPRRQKILDDARPVLVLDGLMLAAEHSPGPIHACMPDQLACLMYTSGSTGRPKGVAVTHANIASRCIAPDFMAAGPGEVVLQYAPLAFDAATLEIWAPLLNGGTLAIAPPGRLGLGALAAFMAEQNVTLAWLTAGLFAEMAAAHPEALRSLKQVLAGGDVVPPHAVRAVLGGRASFRNGYGPTETTIFAMTHPVTDAAQLASGVPIGRPVAGTTVRLLDNAGRPVPRGLPAEICVAGDGLARGYFGQPGATADRFRPDPHATIPGARLYRTGDRGRIGHHGAVEFLGRLDRQVKLRGFRVECGDVEAAILAQPGVAQAVVGFPPGEQDHLVAWVVPAAADRSGHLQGWADLFDQRVYRDDAAADPAFDVTGWISTYTGAPIPEPQMRDWARDTVDQVLARQPDAVLEPGCGTGLLLRQIAPHVSRYVGTDAAQAALDRVTSLGLPPHVTLRRQYAADFTGLVTASFDCVLLSSVVQYFPDLAYLKDVLAGALRVLRSGGVVHLADIRDLRHHRQLAIAATLSRAAPNTSAAAVRAEAERRVAQETELLLDPTVFANIPGVAAAELRLQPGPAHNELTRYRFTAVLHTRPPGWVSAPVHPACDLATLRFLLAAGGPLIVAGFDNARLIEDAAIEAAVLAAAPAVSATAVRAAVLSGPAGMDPADIVALAAAVGLSCVLAPGLLPNHFDAGFHAPGTPAPRMPTWQARTLPDQLANSPAGSVAEFGSALLDALRRVLPAPMVPSSIIVMPALKLTNAGKIDRSALPAAPPETARFEAPRGALEEMVASSFARALGLSRVGRGDDFFSLGGHSLLAARIAASLRTQLGREVPLQLFFDAPNVADLAARLDGQAPAVPPAALRPNADNLHDPFPLTDVQQAYWIGRDDAFAVGGTAAHVYFEVDAVALDLDRFQRAWNVLVRRHGMLRAVVTAGGVQRILAQVPGYVVPRHDAATGVRERLAAEIPASDRWPLFRLEASRLADGWRLHVGIDTLVIDAHSLNLIFVELRLLYDGQPPPPPLALSFRDAVLARVAEQESPAYQRSRDYWFKRLDDLPAAPALPLASIRPAGPPHFALLSHRIEAAVWDQVRLRAAARGLSSNSVLLAAFAEALAGWASEPNFTLNLTRFDRPAIHPEMDQVVGDFTALSLLAVERQPNASFAAAAQILQSRLLEDLQHPHPGAVAVMREISRREGRPPEMLFPVVFTSLLGLPGQDAGEDALERFGPVGFRAAQTPQVWLDHGVAELGGDLALTWNVLDGVFQPGIVDAMFSAYLRILYDLATEETGWDAAVAVKLPPVQQARRAEYNATAVLRQPSLLHRGLAAAALAHADLAATIAGATILTHAELDAWSRGLALKLAGMGVGRGSVVAVILPKGWEQAVATLAVLKVGAAYLPLDPQLPPERLRHVLADAGARVALTHTGVARGAWLDGVACLMVDDVPPNPGAPLASEATPNDPAYLIYTSGSTGLPKGVVMAHGAAANTLADLERRLALGAADRVLALSSLSFDLSVWDLFGVPGAGGAAVIPVGDAARDPAEWAALGARHRVTLWNSVPQLLRMRLDASESDALPPRAVLLSGDWIPLPLVATARVRWPGARLIGLGGATEAAIWSILHEIGSPDPAWSSVAYGRPMENQTIHVRGPDGLARAEWAQGEICIGGAGLALGYRNAPGLTDAAFVTDPATGFRLYRTGDQGRFRPDGTVEFLGRRDGQVKVNGFRVELGEVEFALASAPGVDQAAALVTTDGSGERALSAFVTPRTTGAAATAVLSEDAVAAAAAMVLAAAPAELATPAFHTAWAAETARYDRTAEGALAALSAFRDTDERWTSTALLRRTGIAPRYAAWLDRALHRLAQTGALVQRGPDWVAAAPLTPNPDGEQLAAVLTEQVHSAELYADPAIPALYERIFGGCHQALAAGFAALVASLPTDRPVRVLEVGGGYGTATRHLLPLLPPGRAEYHFTDISRFFLDHAADQFAGVGGLHFGLLDLDRPAAAQGIPPGSVDIIVAASVLHDAQRIGPMLTDLAQTLAPGGGLLAIEETQFHPPYDLGMGLQQGFDRMTDRALRPDHPLLSRDGWTATLQQAGFASSFWVVRPGSIPEALGLDVLLAHAGQTERGPSPEAVLDHVRRLLPDHMVPRHLVVLPALPLSANGKLDRRALASIAPRQAASSGLPPRTELEATLLAIWTKLLAADGLGVTCDLFARGADSLVATRAVALMREATTIALPLRTVFEQPSVAALALAIEARRWTADPLPIPEAAELL
jgi:amino acid adenylation domain-containing protein